MTPATSSRPHRYASKVDWWLGLVIGAVPVVALVSAVALHVSGDAGAAVTGWIVLVAVAVIYVGVVWPVAYELGPNHLVVRFGLARSRVRYETIRRVAPTRSPLAAPALSLDRLAIEVGRLGPLIISPADRVAFLDDLATHTPGLIRIGDRLDAR